MLLSSNHFASNSLYAEKIPLLPKPVQGVVGLLTVLSTFSIIIL
jgi:hypothetical protein